MMTVSRFLNSCAMPMDRFSTSSICCDWTTCFSRDRSRLTSRATIIVPSCWPWESVSVTARISMGIAWPSSEIQLASPAQWPSFSAACITSENAKPPWNWIRPPISADWSSIIEGWMPIIRPMAGSA